MVNDIRFRTTARRLVYIPRILSVMLASRASLATCSELIGSHVTSIPDDTPSIYGYARTAPDTTAYRNTTYV